MENLFVANQIEKINRLHPDLAKAAHAVYAEPEVHEAMRVLGKYGLGVMLPHKHDSNDAMIPLPQDEIQSEAELKVIFKKKLELTLETSDGVVVGWRAGPNGEINFSSSSVRDTLTNVICACISSRHN